MTTQNKIHYYLSLCTHRQCVEFALYCAKDAVNTSKLRDEKPRKCIDLIEKWLINPNTVTEKELVNTASAAYNAARAAYHAAHYAAYHATHAAAYHAAYAAHYAANAAATVAFADRSIHGENKKKEQLKYLLTNVLKLNEFDKLMANI
jgi:hypothetical protein